MANQSYTDGYHSNKKEQEDTGEGTKKGGFEKVEEEAADEG